jgi:ABC-type bacteriocin/lantibiotic exporter with double-glycine peptidase domain
MPRTYSIAAAAVMLAVCCAAFAAGLANLWLDVPFVPQGNKDGCGAASIAMVMQYWAKQQGETVRPAAQQDQILHALYADPAHGIYASAMARYFQSNGYRAFGFTANWMDIERELHYGRPLIVAIKPDSGPALHYIVVAGLDEPQQVVLVNDPAQRKLLKEDQSQFTREWKAAGNWALLAVPDASVH